MTEKRLCDCNQGRLECTCKITSLSRVDPCVTCKKIWVEHEGNPSDVECSFCQWQSTYYFAGKRECERHGGFYAYGETCSSCEKAWESSPPTTEYRRAPKVVCKHCIFLAGMGVGIWSVVLSQWIGG